MEDKDRNFKCFRGYTPDTCPKYDLEITKAVYGILLMAAVAMIMACNFIW